jgi:hypothetical protein
VDYFFGLNDKVMTKDRHLARLNPVHKCMRTQPMVDTCPICLGSLAHKLEAYPQESNLPSPSNHQSTDDIPSCGLDAFPRKRAAAPRSEQ